MTIAIEPASLPSRSAAFSVTTGALAFAGVASLGAGAIHAAAAGVHSEHRQAVIAFVFVAAFQLGWGALALVRSGGRGWRQKRCSPRRSGRRSSGPGAGLAG